MSEMRISIIVPVYNVEAYVERCLRSLLENQDLSPDEYEVIVVNDGSPDNSREVIERLQQEFINVVLIDQENQGVSMARNNAISIAKGRYILPIDPDDYIVPNSLLPALEYAEHNQFDILYCAFEIYDENDISIWRTDYSALDKRIDSGYDGYFAVRGPKVKDPDRSVAMFYQLDFLQQHQINYPKDVPMLEDGLFLGLVFSVAQRVGYWNKDFYQRTTRPESATNSNSWIKDRTIDGYLLALKSIDKHYPQSKDNRVLNHLKVKFAALYLTAGNSTFSYRKYKMRLKKFRKDYFSSLPLNGTRFIYSRLGLYMKYFTLLFPVMYKLDTYLNAVFRKV